MTVRSYPTRAARVTYIALAILAAVALSVQFAFASSPYEVVDGVGNTVRLERVPERIVSVAVSGTEILFSLIDHERIVGVTSFDTDESMSNVAELAREVDNIIDFNSESVIALNPDLVVVAPWNNPDVVNQIKQTGIPVYVMEDIVEISQIPQNIVALGQAVGAVAEATALAKELEAKLQELDALAASATFMPRVLIYTTWGSTYGRGTTYDELIRRCNAINVADELGIVGWGNVSEENIIATDPDFIVFDFYGEPDQSVINDFCSNPKFSGLSAVVNGRVLSVDQKHMTTTSQFIVKGFEDLLSILHPELLE
jgi:iron complex transport system substrate-binding protein